MIQPSDRKHEPRVLVIPLSTSTLSKYVVDIPNEEDNPGCGSGLPRRCRAVCDEYRSINVAELTDKRGRVSKTIVNLLMQRAKVAYQDKQK